jgi:hypothetical protein
MSLILYQAAVRHDLVHALEQACLLPDAALARPLGSLPSREPRGFIDPRTSHPKKAPRCRIAPTDGSIRALGGRELLENVLPARVIARATEIGRGERAPLGCWLGGRSCAGSPSRCSRRVASWPVPRRLCAPRAREAAARRARGLQSLLPEQCQPEAGFGSLLGISSRTCALTSRLAGARRRAAGGSNVLRFLPYRENLKSDVGTLNEFREFECVVSGT